MSGVRLRVLAILVSVACATTAARGQDIGMNLLGVGAVQAPVLGLPGLPVPPTTFDNLAWSNADPALTFATRPEPPEGQPSGIYWKVVATGGHDQVAMQVSLAGASARNRIEWDPRRGDVGLYVYLHGESASGSAVDAGIEAGPGENRYRPFVNIYDGFDRKHHWGEPGTAPYPGQTLPASAVELLDPTHHYALTLTVLAGGIRFQLADVTSGVTPIWDTGLIRANGFTADATRLKLGRVVSLAWGRYPMKAVRDSGTAFRDVRIESASLRDPRTGRTAPWDRKSTAFRRIYPDRSLSDAYSNQQLVEVTPDGASAERVSVGALK